MKGCKKLRTIALLSAASLLFGSISHAVPAYADEYARIDETSVFADEVVTQDDGWHWSFDSGTLRYTSSGSSADFDTVKNQVKKIIIESGSKTVKGIEKCNGLPNLEEVEYKAPITIKDMCFISSSMFSDCPKLKKVTIGAAREGAGLEINAGAFDNCTSLTDVSFGNGTWHFGYRTFGGCTSLTKFVFPNDMHNVRGDTFIGCKNLKELELSEDNSYMKSVKNTIYETLDPYASKRGEGYKTPCLMFVPEGLVAEQGGDYTVIKGTKDIQYWAFIGNESLKNVTIASTVEGIQHEAFYNCPNLKTITMPKSLKRIGHDAFALDADTYSQNAMAEDELSPQHNSDRKKVNSSITDIYYEGSEDDWKKIEYWHYSLDEGHLDRMTVDTKAPLSSHMADIGIPGNVKIHYNSKITDTDYTVDDVINHTHTMSINSKTIPALQDLGIDLSVKYTTQVKYNGRKHTLTTDKASDKTSNDMLVEVTITDSNTGKKVDTYKVKKVKFKNNKVAADEKAKKAPYFTFQLSATGLDKAKKSALKKVNKQLKSKKNTETNFYFTIDPADISSFTSDNYKGMSIVSKKGKQTVKFNTLALQYKYLGGGSQKSSWIKLKPCRKNDANKKGDYTYEILNDKTVKVNGQHNFKGSATLTVK